MTLAVTLTAGMYGCKSSDKTLTITNVSYDATRDFYEEYNKLFEAYYESRYNEPVTVIQSHGGSGSQARSVVEGCNADVVTLALEHDISLIENTGLIDKGWEDEYENTSSPYTSAIVFLVRKGNPKGIRHLMTHFIFRISAKRYTLYTDVTASAARQQHLQSSGIRRMLRL